MQERDYILRLIEQLGGLIHAALERLGLKGTEEPGNLAGQVLGLALSMDPALASDLAPGALAPLFTLSNLDEHVMALVEQALEIEATVLEGRGDATLAEFRRAQAGAIRSLRQVGTLGCGTK